MNKPIAPPVADSAVNVREIVSPSGLRAWLVEDYAVPIVAVEFAIRGGSTQDPTGLAGASGMIGALLDEGAGPLDSQAFQRALDEKAVELSFHGDRDHLSGRLRTLARNLDRAGELMRLAINEPRFDEAPFLRVREQMNARLRHDANDPGHLASVGFRRRVFAGHPYAEPSEGEIESLAAIELEGLKAHARNLLTRSGLVVAIVGAVSPERAAKLVDELFAGLPAEGKRKSFPAAPFYGLGDLEIIDLDVPQSTIRFGRPALKREDPDYMASVVLAHVLGGGTGLSSRLFREVREKRGLAYSIYAFHWAYSDSGLFGFYAGAAAKDAGDLMGAAIDCLAEASERLGEDEIRRAKAQLKVSTLTALESPSARAHQIARQTFVYGAPLSLEDMLARIDAITLEDVRQVGSAMLKSPPTVVAIGGVGKALDSAAVARRLKAN